MKCKNKLLSLALALVMCLTFSPMPVFAADTVTERYLTDADRKILANADARREAILNSPTTVTVTGTKYYVSNSGNDNNDGKSPEKAWATINKVSNADLRPGDGVFFNRGDIWRDVMLMCKEGVTYSAYGTGEKPKFYGSPEDGANPAYWKLVPGTKNIWEYHMEMQEVGFMHVNGDKVLDDKYVAYWNRNQQKYVVSLDFKTPFSTGLLKNRQFFCDVDLRGIKPGETSADEFYDSGFVGEDGVHLGGQMGRSITADRHDRSGKFYFRCDEGNPGEVYGSIEFVKRTYAEVSWSEGGAFGIAMFFDSSEGVVLDNLCIKYNSTAAASLGKRSTIQNCEIGFIGGGAINYYHPDEGQTGQLKSVRDLVLVDDGVTLVFANASNTTITNNYFHDAINGPYNLEHNLSGVFENIRISGNLIERTGYGTNMTQFFS